MRHRRGYFLHSMRFNRGRMEDRHVVDRHFGPLSEMMISA
jgi:hypothetical protein